ncbi:uncharacterized protein LOC136066778 [Quercus suber]|uniref:uncharacterized protein LOC136066778 n=1 Tax=Quercus suber TaxID=58331 RepID=UPI0032DFAB17
MGPITTSYLRNHRITPWQCAPNMFRILGAIEHLNLHLGLGLTWLDVVHLYECHSQQDAGYYLKSRSDVVRLISCLPKSNKGMKDDYVIVSGAWHDGHHCPTKRGKPDKNHVSPRLSLTNVAALNFLLRSEIFVSEDGQLRSAPLILGYTGYPKGYQPVGNAIVQGDHRLARIDVGWKGFLAPRRVGSSTSSLEEQIDRFKFEGEDSGDVRVIEVSDAEEGSDKHSGVQLNLLATVSESSSDDNMDLRSLMKGRGKKPEQKGAGTSKVTVTLPPAPAQVPDPSLKPNPDLKKKRQHSEVGEKQVPLDKGAKQQKVDNRAHRAQSVESREEVFVADVRRGEDRESGPPDWSWMALQSCGTLPSGIMMEGGQAMSPRPCSNHSSSPTTWSPTGASTRRSSSCPLRGT